MCWFHQQSDSSLDRLGGRSTQRSSMIRSGPSNKSHCINSFAALIHLPSTSLDIKFSSGSTEFIKALKVFTFAFDYKTITF